MPRFPPIPQGPTQLPVAAEQTVEREPRWLTVLFWGPNMWIMRTGSDGFLHSPSGMCMHICNLYSFCLSVCSLWCVLWEHKRPSQHHGMHFEYLRSWKGTGTDRPPFHHFTLSGHHPDVCHLLEFRIHSKKKNAGFAEFSQQGWGFPALNLNE